MPIEAGHKDTRERDGGEKLKRLSYAEAYLEQEIRATREKEGRSKTRSIFKGSRRGREGTASSSHGSCLDERLLATKAFG